jgi:hypothetical protein
MFAATFWFLGIAGLIVAASACLSTKRPSSAGNRDIGWREPPTWDEKADWCEIKKTWLEWYARRQEWEAPKQKAVLSWGRTLTLCAGLCMVGVFLEAEFDQPISIRQILDGFRRSPSVSSKANGESRPSVSWRPPLSNANPRC